MNECIEHQRQTDNTNNVQITLTLNVIFWLDIV